MIPKKKGAMEHVYSTISSSPPSLPLTDTLTAHPPAEDLKQTYTFLSVNSSILTDAKRLTVATVVASEYDYHFANT